MSELHLTVHIGAGSLAEALERTGVVVRRIEAISPIGTCKVEPYWKISGQFRVVLAVNSKHPARTFEVIAAEIAPSWHRGPCAEELWAVWDRRMHGDCTLASVEWAHLQVLPEDDPEH